MTEPQRFLATTGVEFFGAHGMSVEGFLRAALSVRWSFKPSAEKTQCTVV